MKCPPTLLDAMADSKLFAPWFRNPTSWAAWRASCIAHVRAALSRRRAPLAIL